MKGLFTYGEWTEPMTTVVRPLVAGQVVWDLGAGTLGHSFRMLELGASHVVAVDKNAFNPTLLHNQPITGLGRTPFHTASPTAQGIQVALVAFPNNHNLPGLIRLLKVAETVIYLGSNVSGSACGWPGLWDYLHFREIVGHVPYRKNSLIVYGRHLKESERRPLVGEEVGASRGMLVEYEAAERIARQAAAVVALDKGSNDGDSA